MDVYIYTGIFAYWIHWVCLKLVTEMTTKIFFLLYQVHNIYQVEMEWIEVAPTALGFLSRPSWYHCMFVYHYNIYLLILFSENESFLFLWEINITT